MDRKIEWVSNRSDQCLFVAVRLNGNVCGFKGGELTSPEARSDQRSVASERALESHFGVEAVFCNQHQIRRHCEWLAPPSRQLHQILIRRCGMVLSCGSLGTGNTGARLHNEAYAVTLAHMLC